MAHPLSLLSSVVHTPEYPRDGEGKVNVLFFFASFFGGGKGFVYPNLVAGRSCLVDSVAFSDLMRISQAVPVSIVDGGGKLLSLVAHAERKGVARRQKRRGGGWKPQSRYGYGQHRSLIR